MVLLIASLTLLTLDFRNVGPFDSMQRVARDALNPVRSAAETVFSPVTDAWGSVFDGQASSDELEALEAENAQLRNDLIAAENAEDLLGSALLQLDIPYVGNLERVVAQVVAGSIGNFDDYHIEIDKGTDHGILVNMPVISEGGLIGRVVETGRSRSRIVLIVDPDFKVGVRVVGNDEELALARGNRWNMPLIVTEDVNPRVPIEVGAGVVTSGLGNSLYPANIPVGFISEAQLDEGALTQILEIEPTGDLDTLRFVTVLLFEPEEFEDLPEIVPGDEAEPAEDADGAETSETDDPVAESSDSAEVPQESADTDGSADASDEGTEDQ